MQIKIDENGVVLGFCRVGEFSGGFEFKGEFPGEAIPCKYKFIEDKSGDCSLFREVAKMIDGENSTVAKIETVGKFVLNPDFSEMCPNHTLEERVAELEAMVERMTYRLNQISEGVTEVVKVDDSDMPSGDYLNPIRYIGGMDVEVGKFYTDGEDVWECVKGGTPSRFADIEFFEVL